MTAETPARLREKADRLERALTERAVEARCKSHGYTWDRFGLAYEQFSEFVPCVGDQGRPHYNTYNDDYGSAQSCPRCRGSGQNFVMHRHRRPEYDAPRPKEAV